MRVRFLGYDARQRRWHPKVARAAADAINVAISSTPQTPTIELWARFDVSTEDTTVLVRRCEGRETHHVVVFAAANWTTVASSIGNATTQLAAALAALDPASTAPLLHTLGLRPAQLPTLTRSTEIHPLDSRRHMTFALQSPLSPDDFVALTSSLDQQLAEANLGEVTGTGWSVSGEWSLDLATDEPEACLSFATSFLTSRGIASFKLLD